MYSLMCDPNNVKLTHLSQSANIRKKIYLKAHNNRRVWQNFEGHFNKHNANIYMLT